VEAFLRVAGLVAADSLLSGVAEVQVRAGRRKQPCEDWLLRSDTRAFRDDNMKKYTTLLAIE